MFPEQPAINPEFKPAESGKVCPENKHEST